MAESTSAARLKGEENADWQSAIGEIIATYSEVERRSLSIPGFSLAPFGIYLWSTIKFTFFLELDLFLLVPMNFVILMRNVFPGRWRYRSFSGRYIKATIQWFKNVEVPIVAIVAIQSFTRGLLVSHFHERLDLIRRRVMLEDNLSEQQQEKLVSAIDKTLLQWPTLPVSKAMFTYGLPLLSPIGAFYRFFFPAASGTWTRYLIALSLAYALMFLGSAFMLKRGLMLGGVGRSAYFPGFLEGRGAYAIEERILNRFGLVAREFPLGFVLSLILLPLNYVQAVLMYDAGIYKHLAGAGAYSKGAVLLQSMCGALLIALLGAFAVVRRARLGRC